MGEKGHGGGTTGFEDYYAVLGIGPASSARTVERAFRKMSRRCHPEVNPGDAFERARYETLMRAWGVLGNPAERAVYDRLGHAVYLKGRAGEPERAGTGGERRPDDLVEEIIGHVLGVSPGEGGASGGDIQATVSVDLAGVITGRKVPVRIIRREPCVACGGAVPPAPPIRRRTVTGYCPECGGGGLREGAVTIRVPVPAGAVTGTEVRVRGCGHAGPGGLSPGDLVATVRVEEHPSFTRRGDNIFGSVTVPVWEADISVPTLAGPAPLAIRAGTQPGEEYRLPGLGLPNPKTGRRGDHVVRVLVTVPAAESPAEKKLFSRVREVFTKGCGTIP
jgi:molecular chaperone DnaJ